MMTTLQLPSKFVFAWAGARAGIAMSAASASAGMAKREFLNWLMTTSGYIKRDARPWFHRLARVCFGTISSLFHGGPEHYLEAPARAYWSRWTASGFKSPSPGKSRIVTGIATISRQSSPRRATDRLHVDDSLRHRNRS